MDLFSHIKSHLSILNVAGEYTNLKQAGSYWKGSCPLHHEKTGSFTVSPEREIFYCFGCHTGGDVITFITHAEKCSAREATLFLAEKYSISIPEEAYKKAPITHNEKKRHSTMCSLMTQWCIEQRKAAPTINRYLEQRGFSSHSIEAFEIGYFPAGTQAIHHVTNFMQRHNIMVQDLLTAHILIASKTAMYSPFEDRIIFPIKDHLGRACGFGGRVFKSNDTRAKYYNSKESEFFHKGSMLYGFDRAKPTIKDSGAVIVVEGYTDCIALAQHGYTNCVATLGTACTAEHVKTLSHYADTLYTLYDADAAGQKAVNRLTKLCWDANIDLHVTSLPDKEDPASILKKNDTLEPYLENSREIFDYYLETSGPEYSQGSLREKLGVAGHLLDIVRHMKSPLKQGILMQKMSQTLGIPLASIEREMRQQTSSTASKPPQEASLGATDPLEALAPLEKRLFSAIINNIDELPFATIEPITTLFGKPLDKILNTWIDAAKRHISFNDFFNTIAPHEQACVSHIILEQEGPCDKQLFEQYLQAFQKKHWKAVVARVKLQIDEAKREKNEQKARNILNDFLKLKEKMVQEGAL